MMVQIMNQDFQTLNLVRKYKFLKNFFQFILSLSIFSLIISYYSSWTSLFLHSINVYFSSSPFHFAIERNYLLLLCIGILVLLSVNCGYIASPTSETESEFSVMNYVELNEIQMQSVVEEGQKCRQEEEEQNDDEILITDEEVEEDIEKAEDKETEIMVTFEEVQEGNMLSTEELNRKCDEFIRKMKEELKIELINS